MPFGKERLSKNPNYLEDEYGTVFGLIKRC